MYSFMLLYIHICLDLIVYVVVSSRDHGIPPQFLLCGLKMASFRGAASLAVLATLVILFVPGLRYNGGVLLLVLRVPRTVAVKGGIL